MNKKELIERIEKIGTVTDFFKWIFETVYTDGKYRNPYAAAYNFKKSNKIHWAMVFAVEKYEKKLS